MTAWSAVTPSTSSAIVCHMGRIGYEEAWELQRELQARLIEAKRADVQPRPPHIILTVEHSPVFTLGKSGDRTHLVASDDQLRERNATFLHIDRGGDITYHGPGQLVVYPILDLDRIFTDVHRYLRELEEAVIRTCAAYGVIGGRAQGRTGVWVGPDERGPERKICAMGIRCSRWVTMHGLALNVRTDLSYFDMIVPCGISDRGVTSLERETEGSMDEVEVRDTLMTNIADCLGVNLALTLEGDAAHDAAREFARNGNLSLFTDA
jgi:lipoyl(octanoyl) transferase